MSIYLIDFNQSGCYLTGMRNLNQYPITDQEIIETLRRMADDLASANFKSLAVGDLRPMILRIAAEKLESQ